VDVVTVQDEPDYAPGTQKNVSGEVLRWNNVSGPERIDAKKYIELLEAEIEELNSQVGRKTANGQNELLEYLKSLEPQNLKVFQFLLFSVSWLGVPLSINAVNNYCEVSAMFNWNSIFFLNLNDKELMCVANILYQPPCFPLSDCYAVCNVDSSSRF
jgi:hypothetical protein